ncbi:gliding motility-associated C-terminal domain-containing protein [Reichenbachiella agarivorans]|uniref:Gliding motility-associated C-terminal domain-containing protein n=1 Tax=Reichenbachiella agarivorans TaxID=2979464 RepID=A0ABY6CJC4_9BACT|nr:gliding motility-associated C-terminal domain-containing protein [Reichenbachiella agarivorans]UXP30626.1 gliding motility-associated C-terminal domain-containing protein [Reichenbachiella agarivorans]
MKDKSSIMDFCSFKEGEKMALKSFKIFNYSDEKEGYSTGFFGLSVLLIAGDYSILGTKGRFTSLFAIVESRRPSFIFISTLCLSLFISSLWLPLAAQGLVNDDAMLSITSKTLVTINTHFNNQGNLINRGQIDLSGSFVNTGLFDNHEGLLKMVGEQQYLSSNSTTLDNLIIDNHGWTYITTDLVLKGNLEMRRGLIKIDQGVKLVLDSTLKLTGVGEKSYFVGRLFRSGKGSLQYPIGTESEYLPVWLDEVEGLNPLIGMEAYTMSAHQELGEELVAISNLNYWRMTRDQGYRSGTITLPYKDEISNQNRDYLVIAQAKSSDSKFHSLGMSKINGGDYSGFITSEGIANGSLFAVGYVGEENKLPPLKVINVLTPYLDGKHDFLRIENIELYEENEVEIFNRNGDMVFKMSEYDNRERVFLGFSNVGRKGELVDGTYFYTITKGSKAITSGFIFLKR